MFDLGGYSGLILSGLKQTLLVGLSAMVITLVIGIFGALAKNSSRRSLKNIATFYTATIRGIPELILLLLIFYGVPTIVQDTLLNLGDEVVIDFNPFVAGTLTLAFIYGAFATEVFRGAMNAVPKGQIEAAYAVGMTPMRMFTRVQLPQAIRFAIPGISNIWMLLIKATALISIIQLDDVMRMSKVAANATREPFTIYLFAALLYLTITVVSMLVQKKLEKHYSRGYA
jgi:His/Glu/Gln/Arg/opine family amino acid ABC transporter permease subunit